MKKITSVKQQLLDILKKKPDATMDDIMVHFTISDIAVRKHIRQLETEGFIQKEKHKQAIGRPFYSYHLTQKGHELYPNHYKELPVELLDDLQEIAGKETVDKLFEKRMQREKYIIQKKLRDENLQDEKLEQRLQKFVMYQNERGYMIHVDETDDGNLKMKNFHCPVHHLAENYQQMCQHEEQLYKQLFPEKDVSISQQITEGKPYCEWKITTSEQDKK